MDLKITLMISLLFVFSFFIVPTSAQNQTSQTYWHNSDYYSIQLNGVGSGFISGEMNLQSLSKYQVNTITLSIPYTNVTIYRIISVNESYYRECIECVYPSYYNSNPQFVNYTTTNLRNSTMLEIHLNQPLVNNSEITLYLFFSTRNLAQKTPQGYHFSFKTIIDYNALVRDAYASVEVPQNMHLKGEPTFNISYAAESAQGKLMTATSPSTVTDLIPSLFYTPYQYHTSNLLSGESFTVTGLYGSNLVLLYAPEILIAILIAMTLILLLKFVFVSKIKKIFSMRKKGHFAFMRPTIVGAFSGFIFQIAYYSIQLLYTLVNSYYYYSSPLPILLILLSLVIYGLSLFGLPYYLYARFGKKEGILAGIISITASIIYFIIIFYLFPPVVYNGLLSLIR